MSATAEQKLAEARELKARAKAAEDEAKEIRRREREERRAAERAEQDRKVAVLRDEQGFSAGTARGRDWIALNVDAGGAELDYYDGTSFEGSVSLSSEELASLRDYLISLNLG